jgi:hypothetical protein
MGIAWFAGPLRSELILLADKEPQRFFSGAACKIRTVWHNAAEQDVAVEIQARLSQASSATAAPISDLPGKRLHLLAQQTILDSVTVNLPVVKGETLFIIQWHEANSVIATTCFWVYPPDLLQDLLSLAGDDPIGVFDPQDVLKPLFKKTNLAIVDLQENAAFSGKLAIFGPFESRRQMREDVSERVKDLAGKGVGVVWMQPPEEAPAELKPSFFIVPEGKGTVVVVEPSVVANLAEDPRAQRALIGLANFARFPKAHKLPLLP